jgi:hypothetical protein
MVRLNDCQRSKQLVYLHSDENSSGVRCITVQMADTVPEYLRRVVTRQSFSN